MSEPLFQLCPLCRGSKRLPPDVRVCDLPEGLKQTGACICRLGKYPGFIHTGITLGQVEGWRLKAEGMPK